MDTLSPSRRAALLSCTEPTPSDPSSERGATQPTGWDGTSVEFEAGCHGKAPGLPPLGTLRDSARGECSQGLPRCRTPQTHLAQRARQTFSLGRPKSAKATTVAGPAGLCGDFGGLAPRLQFMEGKAFVCVRLQGPSLAVQPRSNQ